MADPEIRLWPGVPDLHALGARSFEDLMGLSGELEGEAEAERGCAGRGRAVLRYALPGTVQQPGAARSAPRGAGTGYVDLQRWTGGTWSARYRARFKSPRSASFAAEAWNLFCHLRQGGVGTAQPMAMGQSNAALFAPQSFLVTRVLEPMQALPEYLAEHLAGPERRNLVRALGLFMHRIFEVGVELPGLVPDQIYVSRPKQEPSCAIAKIAGQRQRAAHPSVELSTSRLPELALSAVEGGRIHRHLGLRARAAQLELWSANAGRWFSPQERLRLAHYALRKHSSPLERRRALRLLQVHG